MLEPHRDTGTMGEYRTSQWTAVEHIVRVNTKGVWAVGLIKVEGVMSPLHYTDRNMTSKYDHEVSDKYDFD